MFLVGQIGPLTTVFEVMAAGAGAGIVLGGFAIGTARHLTGSPKKALAAHALTDGYIGGVAGVSAIVIDCALRYLS